MMTLLYENLKRVGYGKLAALIIGCSLFSVSAKVTCQLTFAQYILSVISDHYYLTYFIMPIVLLIIFSFIEDDGELTIVRFRSYFSYFCLKWLGIGGIALLVIVIQTAVIMLSGIGLGGENAWTLPAGSVYMELFDLLQPYFKSPLSAFTAYTLFQFAGIWFLAGVLMWTIHFAGRKWSVRILMFFYLLAALWIKVPALWELPLTGFNHLLILHHNIGDGSRLAITGITVILLTMMILFTVHSFWRSKLTFTAPSHHGLTPYYMRELVCKKNMMILGAVVVGIVLYKGLKNPYLKASEEWICFLFAGHGTGYLHLLSFLEMLTVNSAVLYLLAIFIEEVVSGQSIFVSVRAKGRKELLLAILTAGSSFVLIYCILWITGGILGSYLFGYAISAKSWMLLLCSTALKFLDLLLQFMILSAIYICTRQITIGFLFLTGANLFCILSLKSAAYLPLGLSSMARINIEGHGIGISPQSAFAILILFVILVFSWHLKYGHKKF